MIVVIFMHRILAGKNPSLYLILICCLEKDLVHFKVKQPHIVRAIYVYEDLTLHWVPQHSMCW